MTFDDAFDRTIGHEGQYCDDPEDPGGETKWGISKRSYPMLDIKNLTRDEAKEIYRKDFWEPLLMNELHPAVIYQLFDFAINSGIQTAIRYFQRSLGVADDGHFGPVSKDAVRASNDNDIIMNLNAERLVFMTRLKDWNHDGRGWACRIAQNLKYASLDN